MTNVSLAHVKAIYEESWQRKYAIEVVVWWPTRENSGTVC